MDPVEKKDTADTGLGLGNFLSRGEASPKESSPAKPDKAEAKADKPEDKKEAKAPVVDKAEKPAEKVKDEALTEARAKAETETKTEPDFKPNWDDDNNPWKKKASEFDQRYRDTHRNWNQLNQQNQELQRQLTILGKKFDGTYDPQVDEPPPPDPTAIRTWGAIEGKAQASFAAATRIHGQDKVMQALDKYAQVFGNDYSVQQRILMSDDPVQGAMDAVAGYEFFAKYGNDPGRIVETIKAQLETELAPKIREAESKRIMAELAPKHREPGGIGKVLGGNGAGDKEISKDNLGRPKSLGDITGFGH